MNFPLLVIGVGNMGSAFVSALIHSAQISPSEIFVCDPSAEKRKPFEDLGCNGYADATDAIPLANTILFAMKPQGVLETLSFWKSYFSEHQIGISMMAGVSLSTLCQATGIPSFVRIMPNTPMLVGEGIIGYSFSDSFPQEKQKKCSDVFEKIAVSIFCDTEAKIDAITALSGSGPAYYFYLLENMQQQAEDFGFSEEDAQKIALQTIIGAGALAQTSSDSFAELRQKVTSKGGTTQAALEFFTENTFGNIWKTGMQKAFLRAKEMGKINM